MKFNRILFVLLVPLFLVVLISRSFKDLAAQIDPLPARDTAVASGNDQARAKIAPELLITLDTRMPDTTLPVLIRLQGPAVLDGLADRYIVRPFLGPNGEQTAVAQVPVGNLIKLASQPGISRIATLDNPIQPPEPPEIIEMSPDDREVRLAAIRSQPVNARSIPNGVRSPDDWMDIGDVHQAAAAWSAGYTGQGVKVLVNDSGLDFCHPDLIGTWAVVDDAASPYDGWPLMFDSYSMYLYALDRHFGQTNIADGLADYADTSATCSLSSCVYQSVGASTAHTYTLPATSLSNIYHIGSHPDKTWESSSFYSERIGVLVVDENAAGEYDTVYVDLDNDYDFTDETPATKEMPIACLDNYDSLAATPGADGYNDLSGGLVYFIANGVNPIPASDWLWGGLTPDNGDLVAFALVDPTESAGAHGQWTASNVVAKGIIDGQKSGSAAWKPAGIGVVQGMSRQAKITNNGNFYRSPFLEDGFLFAALGYDGLPGTADDSQVINNSWGDSQTFNDGWDGQSRLVDWVQDLNPGLSFTFSAGNSGPGYGSNIAPAPSRGVKVGASTLFGSTASFDSITDTAQILWGDIIPFSSRGPGARGGGVDVTANGAYGTMDQALNVMLDGWQAWGIWLGTSRSAPVASGVLALIYDAFFQANGRWPTAAEAKAILAAGATDQHYDAFSQGSGMVDALVSALIAAGDSGFYVLPSGLTFGDFKGVTYPGFANVMAAGESATAVFTVTNPTASNLVVDVVSDQLIRTKVISFTFTSQNISEEDSDSLDPSSRHVPDYLIPITDVIPMTADLMEVNLIFPYDQFDPDGNSDNNNDQRWLLQVINWTDVNGDQNLWEDSNGNGVVNQGEIDIYEYNRFSYDERRSNSLQVRVQQPVVRMTDGLFIDLRHRQARNTVPTTTMQIELAFYEHAAWDWLDVPSGARTVPAGGQMVLPVTMTVPVTAPGLYSGFLQINGGGQQSQLPLMVNVAAQLNDEAPPAVLGGQPPAETLYDNGRLRGHFSWNGDASSGDWRFFYAETADLSPAATMILSNIWEDRLPYRTDMDTLVYGPTVDGFSQNQPEYFGPYSLATVAGSDQTFKGGGKWDFQTSTGAPADRVTAPLADGLHLIVEHNVLYQGDTFSVPFTQTVGTAVLEPAPLTIQACGLSGSVPLALHSNVALPAMQGSAFGLSQPQVWENQTAGQDVYNEPSSATFTRTLTISNSGRLEIFLQGLSDTPSTPATFQENDLDLYLLFDEDGSGDFNWSSEILARSTSIFVDEFIRVDLPENGDYLIAVYGARVPDPPALFDLRMLDVSGADIELTAVPSGPNPAGETMMQLNWNKDVQLGETWQGVVSLSLPSAPAALATDVTVVGCGIYLPVVLK